MKTRIVSMTLLLLCTLFSVRASVDQMPVSIHAKSITEDSIGVRNFAVGVQIFTNRTNMPINSIPSGFEGFKFLAAGALSGVASVEGCIIPSQSGTIYIAIRNGTLSANDKNTLSSGGWTKTNYEFVYATASMYIYQKTVSIGDTVAIPLIEDFRGAIPIAKEIYLHNMANNPSEVDPMAIDITAVWSDRYTVLPFQNGELFMVGTNASWTLNNVPKKYSGFKFFSSPRDINVEGTIKASAKGRIYVLAQRSLSELISLGWKQVDTCSYAANYSPLGIYEKNVDANEEISIPQLVNWKGASPLAKEINFNKIILADSMAVTVEISKADEKTYKKLQLDNGVKFFTDRAYIASGVPYSFKGFDFLSNGGATYERGTIIPSRNGLIYVVAKPGGLDGWEAVENSTFHYSTDNPIELTVYQKKVKAGERVEMPFVQNFQGITPIARTIDLQIIPDEKEARLDSIWVDGKAFSGFMRETDTYQYYLPYTYGETNKPAVTAKAINSNAFVSVQGIETLTGTDDERSATIRVSSQDGTVSREYKLVFTILPKMDMFLCIGQSNMSGYAPYESEADLALVDNAFLLNASNDFEPARNPMNRYSTVAASSSKALIGPAYSFAQSMTGRSDSPVGLIVNARGGSSIESWTKDSLNNWYLPTMERVREAMKWGEFKAILWHQGEANKGGDLEQYKTALQQLVSNLRTDIGNDTLLFVAGQIGTFGLNTANFNEMIKTISTFIPHSACASSEGLTNIPGDTNHFDRSGAMELGVRYAQLVSDRLYLPEMTAIKVETDAGLFGKKSLRKGVLYYLTDRTYTITTESFSGFDDFEFLSHEGDVKGESGVIIPETDGYVYVIASKSLAIPGFRKVFGSDIYLSNKDNLCIHRRKVKAGERIEIFKTTDFRGICPVAKQITLIELRSEEDTRLSSIQIDGIQLNDLDENKTEYTSYLPYTAKTTPVVTATPKRENATIESIVPAKDITSSDVNERTTLITVKAADQVTTKTYRLVFEVLPELDLFLCIGQSNMAGAAKMEEGDTDTIDKALLFNNSNMFEPARNGMNRYANVLTSKNEYYGLTYAFAKKIVANTGKNIGLIVNARGGSSIELWEKGGTDAGDTLYVKTMERALEAQKWGTYKAVLWAQGEADYLKVKNQGFNYQERLVNLATNLREDLGNSDLLFIVGEISHWRTDNAAINAVLSNVETYLDHSACVSAVGFKNLYGKEFPDDGKQEDNHFNRESLIMFGERYAQIVLDRIYGGSSGIELVPQERDYNFSVIADKKKIRVESAEMDTVCTVSDISGKLIRSALVNGMLDVPVQTEGIYLVRLTNNNYQKIYKLIIL